MYKLLHNFHMFHGTGSLYIIPLVIQFHKLLLAAEKFIILRIIGLMVLVLIFWYGTLFFLSTFLLTAAIFSTKKQQILRRLPGPLALPIIGHLHLLGPKIHRSFDELSHRYGPLFHLRLGSVPCVVVSTPEMAKEFLKTHELVFSSRQHSPAIEILTHDVSFAFAPYGPYWKLIKKLCTQELLGTRNLNHFQSTRTTEMHRFLHHLLKKAGAGETVNFTEEILKLTNNIISQMMISVRCSETEGEAEKARTVVREVTQIFGELDVSDFIWFSKNLDLQGIKKRAHDISKKYDALVEKVISDREEERSLKQRVQRQPSEESLEKKNDFLDILLNAMEDNTLYEVKLTRNHIKALILDFFTAATDTSAIGLEWALAELINNPKVLKKAQEEINKVIGHHMLAQESDIPRLPYIQAIIKETFRLHPPIPMVTRKSVEDCTVGGCHIPANTLLFVNVWSIGRNHKYWEDPSEFLPERFLEDKYGETTCLIDVKGQHFELLPFGTGRRGCPGMPLAMQELPTVLALLIQCFEYEVPSLHDGKTNCIINMDESPGLTAPRATDLMCLLKPRIDPSTLN